MGDNKSRRKKTTLDVNNDVINAKCWHHGFSLLLTRKCSSLRIVDTIIDDGMYAGCIIQYSPLVWYLYEFNATSLSFLIYLARLQY